MTARTFIILLLATAIGVLAAAAAVITRPGDRQLANQGQLVFPGLIDRINDVASIRLESADAGTLTFERDGAVWKIKERDGYPAKGAAVKGAAVALARLTYLAAKTAKPELYGRLDLQDPKTPGSRSVSVALDDKAGNSLGRVILGTARSSMEGSAQGGVYLRLPGDAQAWFAKGEVNIGRLVQDWIERKLVDIKTQRIRRVEIHHPDGETVVVFKDQAGDPHFILADLPDGKKLKSEFDVDAVASKVGDYLVDDVAAAANKNVDPVKALQVVYETFDGLKLTVLVERQTAANNDGRDEYWLQMAAEGSGEAAKEAAEINARTRGWSFEIADYRFDALAKRINDLVEDAE